MNLLCCRLPGKGCQKPLSFTSLQFTEHCCSVFVVQSAISSCALYVQKDANGCAGRKSGSETKERWRCNNIQGVCKRPHRDGDILSIPSGEAIQDSCWDSFFLSPPHSFVEQLLIVQSAQHNQLFLLIGSTFLNTHETLWLPTLLTESARRPVYLRPPCTSLPLGTDP